jgi:hypothetical protein
LISVIPSLLSEKKYNELIGKNDYIKKFYDKQQTGFYKCIDLANNEKDCLKQYFSEIGFSAMNFTDSRGVFQFYNLSYLWEHINVALDNKIEKLNIATEPVSISELYTYIRRKEFHNEVTEYPPKYNFKTKYSKVFNGDNGYIFTKKFILNDIKNFVENYENKK